MKLAKKMLACAMALAMVAAFALTAFAAAPVVSLTADQYANVGDEITVVIAGKNIAGLEAADLIINYDETALEFVKAKAGSTDFTFAGGKSTQAANTATASLMYLDVAEADATFCTFTFKVLKAGDTKLSLVVDSWAGTEVPANVEVVVSQKVAPTTAAPTTAAPTTAAPTTAAPTTEAGSEAPTTNKDIPQTGEAGVAAIAGVMALAAVAFVATRKKDEE